MARKPKSSDGAKQTEKLIANVTPAIKTEFEMLCELKKENVNTILNWLISAAIDKYKTQIKQALEVKDDYERKIKQIGLQEEGIKYDAVIANAFDSTSAFITADNTQESSDNAK